MILSCPSCTKRFLLDAALLGDGRKVRCGQCFHTWWQEPPPAERGAPAPVSFPFDDDDPLRDLMASADGPEAEIEAPRLDPIPIRQRPMPRRSNLPALPEEVRRRRVPRSFLQWGGLLAVLVLAGGGLVLGREPIVQLWEPAAALYEAAGLPVEPLGAGLELGQGKAEFRDVEGTPMLFVEAPVTNRSDRLRTVPDVIANAVGPDGKLVQSWRIHPAARRLAPGDSTSYTARVPERGGQAKNIEFQFAAPETP
ncbi:MAG TPA: zinc-ribbon domain-containing protein [Azospirillaceae bacterium]|nr:zinc-ribbon domain-containing protein [Azospirillaceae bacterium]